MEKELYAEMAEVEKSHWWFLGRRAIIFSILKRYSRAGRRLLDIGVGTGINAREFLAHGYAVSGVEPSQEAIHFARVTAPGIALVHDVFPSPQVMSGGYDIAVLLDVLEHFDDDSVALRGVADALAGDGIVLITVPAWKFLWTGHDELAHHKRRYRKAELRTRITEAGFEPLFLSYYNFFLFPAIALVRLAFKAVGFKKKTSDFSTTPGFLNWPLSVVFGSERFLLSLFPLPFGVSLIAVAKKKASR